MDWGLDMTMNPIEKAASGSAAGVRDRVTWEMEKLKGKIYFLSGLTSLERSRSPFQFLSHRLAAD